MTERTVAIANPRVLALNKRYELGELRRWFRRSCLSGKEIPDATWYFTQAEADFLLKAYEAEKALYKREKLHREHLAAQSEAVRLIKERDTLYAKLKPAKSPGKRGRK